MRALLLAGGYGTRLRPITDHIPKCLVPINGRALLDFWLETLDKGGVENILVNTHYKPEAVREFVDRHPSKSKITLVHEDSLLGTGGTILKNRGFLTGKDIFVAHADNLTLFSFKEFARAHANRPKHCLMTMMSFETDSPQTCGILELDSQGVVRAFHEKKMDPPGNLANGAVYIFSQEIFTYLEKVGREVVDISTEILPQLIGKIYTYKNSTYHRDIGNPESLALAEKELPLL